MSGEFNPYTPPETDVPSRMDVPEGRLWKIEGGRLLVRDHTSLPDVCVLGTVGQKGAKTSETISVGNRWMRLFSFAPLLVFFWFYVAESPPLGLFIAALVIMVMFPLVMSKMAKSLNVMAFRSRRRGWLLSAIRAGIWPVVIVCSTRIGDPFVEAGLISESASDLLPLVLIVGAVLITEILSLQAFTGAIAAEDGWFELKGVRATVIERLTKVQERAVRVP